MTTKPWKSASGRWTLNDYGKYFANDVDPMLELALDGKVIDADRQLALQQSMRLAFDAMYGLRPDGAADFGVPTVSNAARRLRALMRWMADHNIWSLADLHYAACIQFLKERRPLKGGEHVTERVLQVWITQFRNLYECRQSYDRPIQFNLADFIDDINEVIRTRKTKRIPGIPEVIAYGLICEALEWIDQFSEYILDVSKRAWRNRLKLADKSRKTRSLERTRFYAEVEASDKFQALRKRLKFTDGRTYKVLALAMSVTEGACFFLLFMLVGFRVSELVALNKNCLTPKEGPNSEGMYFLLGIAAKSGGSKRNWPIVEPVPKIVRFLEELHRLPRTFSRIQALLTSRPTGSPVPLPTAKVTRLGAEGVNKRMQQFLTRSIPARPIKKVRVTPHRCRKAFAQLAVLRDKSLLGPVSVHLGHVYTAFTDGYYVGRDHELAAMLEKADRQELAATLEDLLTAKAVAGRAGESIKRKLAAHGRFRGKRALRKFIDQLIDGGVVLAPCSWGYCVYSQPLSACVGTHSGPSTVRRAPDVCAGCANFSVTSTHLQWWNERAKEDEVFLRRANLSDQARLIVTGRLERTRALLRKLAAERQKMYTEEGL
jgi:integrase